VLAAQHAPEFFEQDGVVDVREEFPHVALERAAVAVRELAPALARGGRALAELAGKTAGDETP